MDNIVTDILATVQLVLPNHRIATFFRDLTVALRYNDAHRHGRSPTERSISTLLCPNCRFNLDLLQQQSLPTEHLIGINNKESIIQFRTKTPRPPTRRLVIDLAARAWPSPFLDGKIPGPRPDIFRAGALGAPRQTIPHRALLGDARALLAELPVKLRIPVLEMLKAANRVLPTERPAIKTRLQGQMLMLDRIIRPLDTAPSS